MSNAYPRVRRDEAVRHYVGRDCAVGSHARCPGGWLRRGVVSGSLLTRAGEVPTHRVVCACGCHG